jgi:predicted nucleic acid-binding protein
MTITVDTNVIFSALYSRLGASHHILRLILQEKVALAISSLETRLSWKSLSDLKRKVGLILDQIPARNVPEWDSRVGQKPS